MRAARGGIEKRSVWGEKKNKKKTIITATIKISVWCEKWQKRRGRACDSCTCRAAALNYSVGWRGQSFFFCFFFFFFARKPGPLMANGCISLIHLSGKHSFFRPPSSRLAISLSAGFLSIPSLHSFLLFTQTCSEARWTSPSSCASCSSWTLF